MSWGVSETTKALQTLTEKHSRVVKDREELEQEKETLEKGVDKLRANISLLEQTNRELLQKVATLVGLVLCLSECVCECVCE